MSSFLKCSCAALFLPVAAWRAEAGIIDHWGPRPASPAVVNPAALSPLQQIISLRGEWDFVTDPRLIGRHRMGKGPGWNEPDWTNARKISVPGCWEAQGVGEPGMSQEWGLPFDCIPRPLNHVYMGTARYRRSVDIPDAWAGKRVWLKVGGVRTEAWFWVNQQRVAHLNTYCGTYKYDITDLVTPGQTAEIVATVRNDTPSRKGCMNAFHRFGGFYRDIELEATPHTWLDDVWVRGGPDSKTALVNVSIRSAGNNRPDAPALKVGIKTLDGTPAGELTQSITLDENGNADAICEVPLTEFRLWTPETPNLYLADVTLVSGDAPVHGWTERFGLRKLEVRGDRFYLNGNPYLLRGFGDDYIYPMTLISPPDREEHRKHLAIAHEAGFNYVRHHTHCEIPEFFEAADETGILIQPELPYYHDITTEGFEFDPLRDIQELYRHYRRYVSFASYSTGNEGHLGSPLDKEIYQWAKSTDPDRIFQHQDGGCNTAENADYFSPNGYGLASSIVPWEPGTFDVLDVPFIAHEYLNLGIKLDPRLAPRFTGAIPAPRSLEAYEESLHAAGLERAWGDACLNAAHALQGYYQKQGIEQARLDPACDGYSYWTIVDVMVPQEGTYTGQGYLNAFWEPKQGGWLPGQFRQFNGPTVILANVEPDSCIAVSGDACKATFRISHFDAAPLTQTPLLWSLEAGERTLASGSVTAFNAPPGTTCEVGTCEFTVPELEKPVHAKLRATLGGTAVANVWDLWFFPKRAERRGEGIAVTEDLYDIVSARYPGIAKAGTPEANAARLVIGSWDHPAFVESVAKGIRGLMIGPADGEPNVRLGWWWLGDQLGTAFAAHPVFGDFPHDGTLSPLWFRLIKKGLPLPLDPKYGEFTYFAVGEGQKQYFAYVCQSKDQNGGRMLITRGVDLLAGTPEGAYLLDAMMDYVSSGAFVEDSPATKNANQSSNT
ncbi:MAG TPA: hypothetical protein PKY01_13990 [Candidatus Hydrogenedentes bacterium]|nr:hypothetical protein [Candidatus Hydrogenedentota bacterium]